MSKQVLGPALAICALASSARADEVVDFVGLEDVLSAFARNGLKDFTDQTVDPQFPTIDAKRADGFTVTATFHACVPERCLGLNLMTPMPARELRFARLIEGSIERSAPGFDAWVQESPSPPVVIIETYLAYDGGVSNALLPSTVMQLMSVVDQTKRFMLSDDPRVVEVWPDETQ
jgi:hypothetical protein